MQRHWNGIWIKAYSGYSCVKPIPHAPYLRTVFEAPEKVKKAIVHLCGLGLHELYINGERVGDYWYTPALSQYDCRSGYVDYCIGSLLRPGRNVLIVHLGSGFYNCCNNWKYTVNYSSWRGMPRMICDVELDGRIVESSGVHWRIHPGPVTFDCHHEGEDYDARLEMPECFQKDFDDSAWSFALRSNPPGGVIELEEEEPCRIIQRFCPAESKRVTSSCYVFDFGTNISGVVEIAVTGIIGTRLTIRYGELIDENGKVDTRNIDGCQAGERFETDTYILRGGGAIETWHPRFVWHGFRYVEITSSDPDVKIHRIEALFISSDLARTGTFCSSSAILNRLHEITLASYRSNFMGIPTDCPTREKFGWTGDAEIALETGWWNFAPRKGLERLLNIIMDSQRPDGTVSTHGPTTLFGFEECSPSYAVFLFDFCRYAYEFDGDDGPIHKYYPKLKRTVEFFENMTRDDLLYHNGYGDWCNPFSVQGGDGYSIAFDPTMPESVLWFYILETMADFATHLGLEEDRIHFTELSVRVAATIHSHFYDHETNLYDNAFRASTAMALCFGIVPGEKKKRTAAALAEQVRAERHRTLDGILGAKFVPRALAENGYAADAFEMLVQSEYPGWGYWIAQGATSLWESWRGHSSRNHIMFGDVSAWMYRYLAGFSPLAPGFRSVRLQPCFVPQLSEVKAEYKTHFGMLRSTWKRENDKILCCFEIPSGSTGNIILPGEEHKDIVGKHEFLISEF